MNEKKPDLRNDVLSKLEGRNDVLAGLASRSVSDALPPHSYPGMLPVNSMMDRRYMNIYPGIDRPPSLWNPLGLEVNHRAELQRSAMEREKQELLRMQYAALEYDRLRENDLLMRERDFASKIPPPLRPADPFAPGGAGLNNMYVPRTGSSSPLVNHNSSSKSNSPSSTVGGTTATDTIKQCTSLKLSHCHQSEAQQPSATQYLT